jgi:hypothetical protein
VQEHNQENDQRNGCDDGPDGDERKLASLIALGRRRTWHVFHEWTMPNGTGPEPKEPRRISGKRNFSTRRSRIVHANGGTSRLKSTVATRR